MLPSELKVVFVKKAFCSTIGGDLIGAKKTGGERPMPGIMG
jgi:hypothetical protein